MITLHRDRRPDAQTIADLYRAAKLNRPVDDLARITRTYEGSPLVITAFDGARLVGILRGWTDGAYDGYVCDLAVDPGSQKLGIGRRLLEEAQRSVPDVQWVLRASEIAKTYYEHIGWKKIENGWFLPRPDWKKP